MKEYVEAAEPLVDLASAYVDFVKSHAVRKLLAHAVGQIVEPHDVVTFGQQTVRQVAADEAGDPRNADALRACAHVGGRSENPRMVETMPRPNVR